MTWFFAILVVLLMGGIAMVAAGRGTPLADEHGDAPDTGLPDGRPLVAEDLRRVRFPLALRGYRMGEVDALLARLADQLPEELPERRSDSERRPDPGPAPAVPGDGAADDTSAPGGAGRGADADS